MATELRSRDWISDVCSSDLPAGGGRRVPVSEYVKSAESGDRLCEAAELPRSRILVQNAFGNAAGQFRLNLCNGRRCGILIRSEEHTSELQSLMRISYAVFCLKKKNDKSSILHAIDEFITAFIDYNVNIVTIQKHLPYLECVEFKK